MKMNDVNTKDCLTVTELAKSKQVSKTAVYKALNENRLDYVELDKIKLIIKNDKIYSFGK
jgi:hypothetical protein